MSDELMTIKDHEIKNGLMITSEIDDTQKVTAGEFRDLAEKHGNIGVDYEVRMQFLKDNNYKVTRKNIQDPSLSSRGN